MSRNGVPSMLEEGTHLSSHIGGVRAPVVASANFVMDDFGEVTLAIDSDKICWKFLDSVHNDKSNCFGIKSIRTVTEIKLADIYAVELIDHGSVHESNLRHAGRSVRNNDSQMYCFSVHGIQRSNSDPCRLTLAMYTFSHNDLQTCQMWVDLINASLDNELQRPKTLLVFVHPKSGKGNGCTTWEAVSPIFARAKVQTKVIVTERAGHAFDVMVASTNEELKQYDGVVAVGGDGFFNEILNGLLSLRHKAPYPPAPTDFVQSLRDCDGRLDEDTNDRGTNISFQSEDQAPLIPDNGLNHSKLRAEGDPGSFHMNEGSQVLLPKEGFRFGIIPAGSTDAIVICTTGSRDPITSALQIVMGNSVPLDIAQIVRWRTTPMSKVEPCVRYAASFAGYGFYGDVITESEKYRWMGPKRYDYAGTKVFMMHRAYEAEVAFLQVKSNETHRDVRGHRHGLFRALQGSNKRQKVICRVNCEICSVNPAVSSHIKRNSHLGEMNWLRSKGRFLSIGAAIIACRNGRAPDGLVADAHLADGFMHLILIKDCPRAFYLGHLLQLAKRDGDPLSFDFVEHHKTPAFTFKSSGESSIWNLDGELFQAHQLSAQVFRGLIHLFASGPPV